MEAEPRKKVLWLIKGLSAGGAERLLLSFARHGDHRRFDFHVAYLLEARDELADELAAAGVAVHCLRGNRPTQLGWIARLRSLLRSERFDVVHIHSPLVAAQARVALHLMRDRPAIITTEHNMASAYHPASRWLNNATLRLDDHRIAVSHKVLDGLPDRHRASTEVMLHGVDVDAIRARRGERDAQRARLGLAEDEFTVVTVASLKKNKDYPTLLKACRLLADWDVAVTMLSVGDGPERAHLEKLHQDLALGRRFRFLGHQRDPIATLLAADLFCLSSRFEGLPVALLEALAAGVPVVATNAGGTREVLDPAPGSTLVPSADAPALAAAIRLRAEGNSSLGLHPAPSATQIPGLAAILVRHESLYETIHAD